MSFLARAVLLVRVFVKVCWRICGYPRGSWQTPEAG